MSHTGLSWALKPVTGAFLSRGRGHTDTQGRRTVLTEAEIEVTELGHQGQSPQKVARHKEVFFPRAFGGSLALRTP